MHTHDIFIYMQYILHAYTHYQYLTIYLSAFKLFENYNKNTFNNNGKYIRKNPRQK
jgi:hypothetical protein